MKSDDVIVAQRKFREIGKDPADTNEEDFLLLKAARKKAKHFVEECQEEGEMEEGKMFARKCSSVYSTV